MLIHWTVHSCVILPNKRESSEKGRQTMLYKVFGCHYAGSQCSTRRLSNSKKMKKGKSHPQKEIQDADANARHYARVYTRARNRLLHLSAPPETMTQYQPLEEEHLNITTVAVNPAQRGTRHASLAWFWSIDVQADIEAVDAMAECMSISSAKFYFT